MKLQIKRHENGTPLLYTYQRVFQVKGKPIDELDLKTKFAEAVYRDIFEKEPPTMWTGKEHPDWDFWQKFVEMMPLNEYV